MANTTGKKATAKAEYKPPAVIGQNRETVGALMNKVAPTLERLLPNNVTMKRLGEVAIYCVRNNLSLAECTQRSFLGSLVQCARLGLYPDLRGEAFLIPRRTGPMGPDGRKMKEAHFQIGYPGLVKLARRSGTVELIESRLVYEEDEFAYEYGTQPFIHHKRYREGAPGAMVATYAIAELKGARRPQFVAVERWEIEALLAKINPDKQSPWYSSPEGMWLKTALIRLCKQLPWSVEDRVAEMMQRTVKLDELADAEVSQGLDHELEAEGVDFCDGMPDEDLSGEDLTTPPESEEAKP